MNTDTNYDNCTTVYNPDQLNSDGNFIDNSPPWSVSQDDDTFVRSDDDGDACDGDADSDARLDQFESLGCNGSGPMDPADADTDDDLFLDGAECALLTDPASSSSKPTADACRAWTGAATTSTDTDADHIPDWLEFCKHRTDWTSADHDGDAAVDGMDDGCEVASVNGDRTVNIGDKGMVALAVSDPSKRALNLDATRTGSSTSAIPGSSAS